MNDLKIDHSQFIDSLKRNSSEPSKAKVNLPPSKQDVFSELLHKTLKSKEEFNLEGVKLSQHAAKRVADRGLEFDSNEFLKIKNGIEKLKNKGGKDSLIVTDKGAYIVDVNNATIVTAMDKDKMSENVFTKIDSTLFLN